MFVKAHCCRADIGLLMQSPNHGGGLKIAKERKKSQSKCKSNLLMKTYNTWF